jgi:hypothetical protein
MTGTGDHSLYWVFGVNIIHITIGRFTNMAVG